MTHLIIISGPPASGKTTLGRQLAEEFHLPFLHKDGLKEALFDSLGWSDREWSKKLGIASYALLFKLIEMQLAASVSHIVEANFYTQYHTPRFLEIMAKHRCETFQIMCCTTGDVLYRRFIERAQSGARHPGHVELENLTEFRAVLEAGRIEPLALGGTLLEIDTTSFETREYRRLVTALRMAGVTTRHTM